MYDKLLDTLEDCLKPKDYNNHKPGEDANQHTQINLNEVQINSLHQLLYPCYITGYRHKIIYGLSGLMHKHHVTIESSILLIQKLSAGDEERDNRLSVLNSTYEKNPKEVSGFQYLLSVLENVVDGGRAYAKSILSKIITIIFAQINNQGIIIDLTERIMTEFTFKTMRDNEEIYYYDTTAGLYRKFGDRIIKEYVEILHPSIKTFQVNEIIQKIKRRTTVDRDQFDNKTDIINVQNGLVSIWTDELRDHTPDFLSIIQLPLVYNPKARSPNIGRFLAQVLHPEDVLTALEVIGYTLYRSAVYEKAVMLYGSGDNGKGVFIKLIEAFVGRENCSHVPLQELDNDKFSSADLFGKLVNTFADLKSQKLLATGYFKTLVSGDSVRAQEKYGKPFSFRNCAKLIFSTNKIPDSDDKSYAYYKRWLILSFEKVFQGMARDTNLINKLTTPDELSGLLNLALISLRRLKKDNGFKEISVEKVKKEYEYNSNTVKAFLDDKCVIDLTAPEYYIPTVYLYNEYENFCQEKRVKPLDMNVFGSKLKEYGIERDRKRNHGDREYYYFGVILRKDLQGQNQSLFNN
jgi:putative DNA primase/helicase